jgi:hypothetical protein
LPPKSFELPIAKQSARLSEFLSRTSGRPPSRSRSEGLGTSHGLWAAASAITTGFDRFPPSKRPRGWQTIVRCAPLPSRPLLGRDRHRFPCPFACSFRSNHSLAASSSTNDAVLSRSAAAALTRRITSGSMDVRNCFFSSSGAFARPAGRLFFPPSGFLRHWRTELREILPDFFTPCRSFSKIIQSLISNPLKILGKFSRIRL